jgi:DNA-binding protein
VDTHCAQEAFCKAVDCVGVLREKYCRSVEVKGDGEGNDLTGVKII